MTFDGTSDIAGVLLAGGLSRRMGGGDKALKTLGGIPLIAHAARRLRPQVSRLIVNANGDPARFAFLAAPVVADETTDFAGPLAGILATLRWIGRTRPAPRALVSVSADAPFIPVDLVARLSAALSAHPEAGVAAAQSRGQRHHVIGLWRREAADTLADALAHGARKAETLVDRLGAVAVPFEDADVGGRRIDPFFNVNTPDDLAAAEAMLPASAAAPGAGIEPAPFVVGVAGWKNSGKTTLVERLVALLVGKGYAVSTVKHTHHDLAPDERGTDSGRHRAAGARQTAVVSPQRWMLDGVVRQEAGLSLADVLSRLAPADVVIVEGYKGAAIPKIEVRRRAQGDGPPLADEDVRVLAIAADFPVVRAPVPVLALDDVAGVASVVLAAAGLPETRI